MIYISSPTPKPEPINRPETSVPDFTGITLVVAEDDLYCFHYVKQLFKRTGVEIIHAGDGNQLMEILDQRVPDLVLLDLQMPLMDGYECLQEIRSQRIETKVIVQTASDAQVDRERIMQAGADGYIIKPFRKNELFLLIDAVLKRKQS